MVAVALGDPLALRHDASARLGLGKAEVDALLFGRDLDPLDLLQFLDAALYLLRLGRLVAEAVDEGFQLLDAVLLVLVGRLQLRAPLVLLQLVTGEAAGIEVQALVPQLGDLANADIQEIAVVRHQHERVRIGAEVLLQPVAGFQVEMVGRLVQQQQIGLFQQQLGERDAHLPAAGKLLGALLPLALRKPEPGEHAPTWASMAYPSRAWNSLSAWWNRSATWAYSALAGSSSAIRCVSASCSSSSARSRRRRSCTPRTRSARKARAPPAGGTRCVTPFWVVMDAGIEALDSRQHLENGRLARAVGAHDADAVVGRDQPVYVFKKDFGAVPFSRPGELDHVGIRLILAGLVDCQRLRNAGPDEPRSRSRTGRRK